MSSIGAARRAAVTVSSARAEASRRNGAKSRGPKTPEGKAQASRNALKHGLRAGKHVLLRDEDSDEFDELEVALFEELAPEGALQGLLVGRMARAAWRLARAERIEIEMFAERRVPVVPDGGAGLAMIRDGNSSRSFETLVRYRSAALAEFTRCLRMLKGLQAERATEPAKRAAVVESAELRMPNARRERPAERAPDRPAHEVQPRSNPVEPETSGEPNEPKPPLQSRSGPMLARQPVAAPTIDALVASNLRSAARTGAASVCYATSLTGECS